MTWNCLDALPHTRSYTCLAVPSHFCSKNIKAKITELSRECTFFQYLKPAVFKIQIQSNDIVTLFYAWEIKIICRVEGPSVRWRLQRKSQQLVQSWAPSFIELVNSITVQCFIAKNAAAIAPLVIRKLFVLIAVCLSVSFIMFKQSLRQDVAQEVCSTIKSLNIDVLSMYLMPLCLTFWNIWSKQRLTKLAIQMTHNVLRTLRHVLHPHI